MMLCIQVLKEGVLAKVSHLNQWKCRQLSNICSFIQFLRRLYWEQAVVYYSLLWVPKAKSNKALIIFYAKKLPIHNWRQTCKIMIPVWHENHHGTIIHRGAVRAKKGCPCHNETWSRKQDFWRLCLNGNPRMNHNLPSSKSGKANKQTPTSHPHKVRNTKANVPLSYGSSLWQGKFRAFREVPQVEQGRRWQGKNRL